MNISKSHIKLMTKFAESLVGIPYKLGGNVPQDGGMDCSAVALELLRSVKLWGLDDARAQDIHNKFRNDPGMKIRGVHFAEMENLNFQEGDFLFWGKSASDITHISYVHCPIAVVEAGGDNKTGMIRFRPINWRKDLVAALRFEVTNE